MSSETETDVSSTLGLLNRKMDVARPVKRHCKFNKFNAFRRYNGDRWCALLYSGHFAGEMKEEEGAEGEEERKSAERNRKTCY